MQEIIIDRILPELLENVAIKMSDEQLEADPDLPRFTLVFDREVSSPEFFGKLWSEHRVAVLTYKKNAKNKWKESDFTEHEIEIDSNKVKMELCEKNIEWNNVELREIRKKNNNSHQTSIITTNKKLTTILIAIKMFCRWTQENLNSDADETEKNVDKQSKVKDELQGFETDEKELLEQRNQHPYKITIKEMEEKVRYNKLDIESKLFQNIIKMICYRAETSFSILLAANYKKKTYEMRALTKSLIKTKANIIPDYKNETLTVELYSLSNPRDNKAAKEICQTLNDSETKFPGTNLRLIYKFATK
jgi:hypothetical protein